MENKSKEIEELKKILNVDPKLLMIIFGLTAKYLDVATSEKLDRINEKLNSIEDKLDLLLTKYEINDNKGVIVVKEMTYEEAKKEVIKYFKEHKQATIVDLHQNLGIEINMLVKILDELAKEDIIGE